MPQKDIVKKTPVSKVTKEKQVCIVKHFQPISCSKEYRNCEFPEIDNDVDAEDYLKNVSNRRQFFHQERKPQNKEVYKNEKVTKSNVMLRKRNKRAVTNRMETSSTPKLYIECTKDQVIQKSVPFSTRKSKSFATENKQAEQVRYKNSRKKILVSNSSPDFNDSYVTNLRREISQNRCKTADAWPDTKLYLMHKNEIYNEKVKHLREEISKLINIDLDQRKSHVTELKMEIAQFKRNECIAVYNLTGTEINNNKDSKSDETCKSSTATAETDKRSTTDIESITTNTDGHAALTETEEEKAEKEVICTDLTVNAEHEENEGSTCRKLCLLDAENVKTTGRMEEPVHEDVEFKLALIAAVESNPILYDNRHPDFKCGKLKLDKWKEIAYRLNQSSDKDSVKMVRTRWKSLRDTLVKEVRHRYAMIKSDSEPRHGWRYSKYMEFLIPHLGESNPAKGNRYKKRSSEKGVVELTEKYLATSEDIKETVDEPVEIPSNSNQEDEIDSFFKGIADTVKKLTPENQIKVQKDIINMVLDVKLWEIKEAKNSMDNS